MKIKTIILSLVVALLSIQSVFASQLPQDVRDYLIKQKNVPTIRHDGVVIYGDEIMYLPVFPAYPAKVEAVKIVKTFPNNQSLSSFPDVIVFNNNFSLIKVIRRNDGKLTVRDLDEYPKEIITGELSQDLMVPHSLIFPEKLAGILGDVYIPLIGGAKTGAFVSGKKAPLPSTKKVLATKKNNVPEKLKNKLFFVNNYQSEYLQVFSSTVSEPLYSLKTSGVMKDVKPALNGKYLIAATKDQKNLDIIDVEGEYIVKHIDLTSNPSEIVVDDSKEMAYVASTEDDSLSVIDLKSLRFVEKIQLAGTPKFLCVSNDGTKIAYMDIQTSNIFVLELDNNYANKLITKYPNTTKILIDNNVLYLISRTKPKLRIVNFDLLMDTKKTMTKRDKILQKIKKKEQQQADNDNVSADLITGMDDVTEKEISSSGYATSIKEFDVGNKPIDMYQYGNEVFVLCAGNNTVYKCDTQLDDVSETKLPVEGFSKAFSPVPDSNLAVITNMSDFKYVVYDMAQAKPLQTVPINDYVNSITILERKNEH